MKKLLLLLLALSMLAGALSACKKADAQTASGDGSSSEFTAEVSSDETSEEVAESSVAALVSSETQSQAVSSKANSSKGVSSVAGSDVAQDQTSSINTNPYPVEHFSVTDLTEEESLKIKTAFLNYRQSWSLFAPDDVHITNYYGDYHGTKVFCALAYNDGVDVGGDAVIRCENVGGYEFWFSDGLDFYLAYKDGIVFDFVSAFEQGWFSAEDLGRIYNNHIHR